MAAALTRPKYAGRLLREPRCNPQKIEGLDGLSAYSIEKRLRRILFFFPRYMRLASKSLSRFEDALVAPYLSRLGSLEERRLVEKISSNADGGDYVLTDLGRSWYSNISCELVAGREKVEALALKYWAIPETPAVTARYEQPRWGERLPRL